jgi:hypothetical protein
MKMHPCPIYKADIISCDDACSYYKRISNDTVVINLEFMIRRSEVQKRVESL